MGAINQRFKAIIGAYKNNTYRDLDVYKKGPTLVQRVMDDCYQEQYAPKADQSPATPAPTLEDNSPDAESSKVENNIRRRKGKNGLMVSWGGSGNTGINL